MTTKNEPTFIIVGASLTGANAASELREQGFDGRIVMVGADPELPYERPPLTKDYLRDESPREKVFLHEESFYTEKQIELELGLSVTAIDPAGSTLTLSDGRGLSFEKLLLCTGADPRRIPIPGAELDGVLYLRTLQDCEAIRERIAAGGKAVVVGAGWIGSELAASARQRGLEVTVIDPVPLPLERVLGPEIGAIYRDAHQSHGVDLKLGEGVAAFEGKGAVERVLTTSDAAIDCDFVVVAVGVSPATQLAQAAGLKVDNGILVDEALVTSAPSIFAAGDVANASHPFFGQRIRVEHWANAIDQGAAAARSMLGQPVSYDKIPYFFSDQYDVGMEYAGYAPQHDNLVFRGDPVSGELVAFWLADGRVIAGININVWDVNDHIKALIQSRKQIDPSLLEDPQTPLESLVDSAASA